jgi:peptide/nickel transport system substrate-binding protein
MSSALSPAGTAVAAPDTTRKREFVVLQAVDLTALDPHGSTYSSDVRVKVNVFDTLVRRHPDGTFHSALATGWRRDSPTTWRFTLRPGVRWHDGSRFTAVDAKYSLDRTFDPSVKAARLLPVFETIARTEVPDPETLLIHTKQPDVLMPARLAFCGQIVPWTYIDRVGYTVFNQRPVGSGPLRFVTWTKGERCVLEANPDYWDGRLDLDRVIFRPVAAPAARLEALLRGDADLITGLLPDHVDPVSTHPATRVVSTPYAGLYVLAVNVWVAPLNDPLVRQALSLAIDRETIVKELWRGRGLVPSGPIPRGDTLYDPALPPRAYDPSAARRRLRRAGYRGEPVYLETTAGYMANDRLRLGARAGEEAERAAAYRRMTALFLEHNPWIVVIQPYEDYGIQRYVEFTPSPDEQLELRHFNFRLRRA